MKDLQIKSDLIDQAIILLEECQDDFTPMSSIINMLIKKVFGQHTNNTDPLTINSNSRSDLYSTIVKLFEMNVLFAQDAESHIRDFLYEEALLRSAFEKAIKGAYKHKNKLPKDIEEAIKEAYDKIIAHQACQEMKSS